MTKFCSDSIISAYLNMVDKTQSQLKLPEYSEIYLRLGFKVACGQNHVSSSDYLQLYRKLLVLHYCQEYSSLESVITIMERCFSIEDIYEVVAEQDLILCKWWEFKNNFTKQDNKAVKRKISSLEDTALLRKNYSSQI